MAVTITTSGAVASRAGRYGRILQNSEYEDLINEAEDFVCTSSRYDWRTNWGSLSGTAGAKIVRSAVTDLAAIGVIENDMSGFTSRQEAQTMLDILWSKIVECVNLLRDEKFKRFSQTGSVT